MIIIIISKKIYRIKISFKSQYHASRQCYPIWFLFIFRWLSFYTRDKLFSDILKRINWHLLKLKLKFNLRGGSTIFKRECIRRAVSHISYQDQRIVIFTGSRGKSMGFIKHLWYFSIHLSRILKLRTCPIKNVSSVNYSFFSSFSLNNYYYK